jgi:beta-N-acetylhexosaminidase
VALQRRKFLAGIGALAVGIAPELAGSARAGDEAGSFAGDVLISGFSGTNAESPSAQALAQQISQGRAAGVLFVKDNIGTRNDVLALTELFSRNSSKKIFLAIDHEGGAVQRLGPIHGCDLLPPARQVARDISLGRARELYRKAGEAMARLGFNFNLAPVVDLHDPANPEVGHFDRAFSNDPGRVLDYARAFIEAFEESGVHCAIKHFPGQGSARGDSHFELAETSTSSSNEDLVPFVRLIGEGRVAAVMSGHVAQKVQDGSHDPAVLSHLLVTTVLREQLQFKGVALTDDLDMGAAGFGWARRTTALKAIRAGNDLLVIRNRRNYDPALPDSLDSWIREDLDQGGLSVVALNRSIERISDLRKRIRV